MIRIERDGLQWLEFELLSNFPNVSHAVLTRHGGFSEGHLASLNLSNSAGDTPSFVQENRSKVKTALSLSRLVTGQQCHGVNVEAMERPWSNAIPVCDGLSTQERQAGLMILQADCQAAIFYDPIQKAIANVHCGWRGSVQNIYKHLILHMKDNYQSKPENLMVCISPGLGPENAEFIHYKTELPEPFWQFQAKPNYFDFWAISEWQLIQEGILPHHIQIARIDTFSHPQDFFSHRRSAATGRNATICALL